MPLPTSAELLAFLASVNPDAALLEPRALTDAAVRGLRWRGGRKLCARYDLPALRSAFAAAYGEDNADECLQRELRRVGDGDSAPFLSTPRAAKAAEAAPAAP